MAAKFLLAAQESYRLGPNLDEPEPIKDVDGKFLLAVQGFYRLGPNLTRQELKKEPLAAKFLLAVQESYRLGPNLDEPEPIKDVDGKFLLAVQKPFVQGNSVTGFCASIIVSWKCGSKGVRISISATRQSIEQSLSSRLSTALYNASRGLTDSWMGEVGRSDIAVVIIMRNKWASSLSPGSDPDSG